MFNSKGGYASCEDILKGLRQRQWRDFVAAGVGTRTSWPQITPWVTHAQTHQRGVLGTSIYSHKLIVGSCCKHHLSSLLTATEYLTTADNALLPTRPQDGLSSCVQAAPPLTSSVVTLADTITILDSVALICLPMVAQCGTAAVLFRTGDLIAQQAIEKKGLKSHDVRSLSPILFHFIPLRRCFGRWDNYNVGVQAGANRALDTLRR